MSSVIEIKNEVLYVGFDKHLRYINKYHYSGSTPRKYSTAEGLFRKQNLGSTKFQFLNFRKRKYMYFSQNDFIQYFRNDYYNYLSE